MKTENIVPTKNWVCENVFCSHKEICRNWTNCIDCKDRKHFLDYVFDNKQPSEYEWGRQILKIIIPAY